MCLKDVEDLVRSRGKYLGCLVSNGGKVWLVFGVGLEARCGFEIGVIARKDLFIE